MIDEPRRFARGSIKSNFSFCSGEDEFEFAILQSPGIRDDEKSWEEI
jgi:hypothetical protein